MVDRPLWDVPAGFPADGSDEVEADSDLDEEGINDQEAAHAFVDFLMSLKMRGKLSAKDVCVLCWYGSRCGLAKPGADLAFRPNAPSGHYQRHLDSVTEMSSKLKGACMIVVPSFDKYSMSRCVLNIPMIPLHEALQGELEEDPSIETTFNASTPEGDWNKDYFRHPVVRNKDPDEVVYPIALYLDGVPFNRRDGLVAVYGYNLCTGSRHLIAVIRKSQVCRCSCQGWCTWYVVMTFLKWSARALAMGKCL